MRRSITCSLPLLLALTAAAPACAQEPLAVGASAPDFALTGATREGILSRPVHLGDYRDKTVVIAFFYRARTKG